MIAGHSFPDYDATFALIWGHDLVHGQGIDYGIPFKPAGHPLTTATASVLSVFGRTGAAEAMRWIVLLGAGALVAGIFRLGQTLFGTAVGVLAALLVFTRTPVWGFSVLGYMDLPAVALVVWAAVLEVRRPRRGASVLILLALAGLVRPEVWLMAGAYWLWLAWGDRGRALRLLPLAIAGPVVWIVWDATTTGTFLGSIHTAAGTPLGPSSGGHGLGAAPRAAGRFVGGFVRPPEAIAGAAGIAFALWRVRERPLVLVPLGVLALNVVGFLWIARSGGALEQRYLFPAAVMLLLFAAYFALGWVEDVQFRAAWRVAGVVCLLAFLAYSPVDADRLSDLRTRVMAADASYSELRDNVRPEAEACRQLHVPDARLRPFVAYWAGLSLDEVSFDPGAGDGTVEATNKLAHQISSRSLPDDAGDEGGAGGWRLTGPCARQ